MVCCGVANYIWALVVLLLGLVHLHMSAGGESILILFQYTLPVSFRVLLPFSACNTWQRRLYLSTSYTCTLLAIPEVVQLEEGQSFTYSYPCEEGVVDWLCYYIDGKVQPTIFSDVAFLPPFLQDGTTSAIQECPEFSTYNISFTVTTSMSGLIMFYANGFSCDITNSVGPRPFLFDINTGRGVAT